MTKLMIVVVRIQPRTELEPGGFYTKEIFCFTKEAKPRFKYNHEY